MKILITGATGFVGKALGQALALRGHELSVLTRSNSSLRTVLPFPHRMVTWNPSKGVFPKELGEFEVVINLAGSSVADGRWTEARKRDIRSSRIEGTRGLIGALGPSRNLKAFINASAVGYYGDTGEKWVQEDASPASDFLAEVCRDWEKELFQSSLSCRKVAVRIGVVLGNGGGALSKMLPIFLNGTGGTLGSGSQYMSWIHLDDLVEIFVQAVEKSKWTGPINAVAPNPVTNSDFTKALSKAVGVPALAPAPAPALKLAMGEMSSMLLGGQRVSVKKLLDLGFSFKYSDVATALRDTAGLWKSGVRVLEFTQYLDRPLEEVFPFFSSEKNLEILTPDFLKFKVDRKSTLSIQKGTLIDYSLKVHGLPMKWRTEFLEWNPPHQFVDLQLKGPYALWHHTHSFQKMGRGTLMKDRVLYKLPMGPLGRLFGGALVKRDVTKIFEFRSQKMLELFPDKV